MADALASAVHSSLQSMIAAEAVLLDFAGALFEERTQEALQKLRGAASGTGGVGGEVSFQQALQGRAQVLLDGVPARRRRRRFVNRPAAR